ncbi:hypothetical protein [Clostridium massiliamazoniense]|uniref:hypothetical protein n=1 Tax=Clostridium massiliamazoniense TaxID=1347366 RepID=UPI0006D7E9DE|nr:hypothetical protein [Clostridium massiliamazoniense]
MDKKKILDEINERIEMLEAIKVSVSEAYDRNLILGKLEALKAIKMEVDILDMNPHSLAVILEEKFRNRELGITGKYVREGFEAVINEYINKFKED